VRPAEAAASLAHGNRLRASGRIDEAVAAYSQALEAAPQMGAAHYNLGIALRQQSRWRESVLAFRAATRLEPADFDAVQNVVGTLAMAVQRGEALFARDDRPPEAPSGAGVSVVVCSIHPQRLERMRGNFEWALGERAREFIVITDARSLCEGYQRGLERSRHDLVVFSHDDVELLSPRALDNLERALQRCDIVGLAGSRLVNGPAVTWAGHPHIHGWIAYPAPGNRWRASVFSLASGLIQGMQSIDGLFFAARRESAARIGFDAATFDGFHFYDLDFSYRAHLEGLALAVCTDAVAIHASEGRFDETWRVYADRFRRKYPHLDAPAGPHHAYSAVFDTRSELARFYDELSALGEMP
jgi:tetratricopeptide (TPR) repeat protein